MTESTNDVWMNLMKKHKGDLFGAAYEADINNKKQEEMTGKSLATDNLSALFGSKEGLR
ncbi:MAG: hypothetical protein ACTSXQ_07260 [Alphaproteobacteria bacterium]